MDNPLSSEAESILSRLYGDSPSKREIIPIVGMGGIGKTTLARYVYKHPSLDGHFDIPAAWVTVSQRYDLSEILRGLLRSINVTDKNSSDELSGMDEGSLIVQVHKTLKGRRYLIVMDDIWHTKAWDALRHALPDDCNGSRIIITTRELEVASYVGDSMSYLHEMQLMSVDKSWELLQEKVFGEKISCPPELEEIGKLVAKKCRGLPLAIVVIAGVLSKLDRIQDSWEKIAENVSQVVNASGEDYFSSDILSVSYMHLPQHLRPCFLYIGCFPEDYEINVSELIRLWVAEEFVITNDESKDMEELGYEYLEDLARRSLVLIEKKRHDGKIKTVKIHDLLRDLCLRKCQDDNFLNIISEFQLQGNANSHRLSIYSEANWDCIPNMERAPIDSILCFWRGESVAHNFWNYFKNFRLTRVLEAVTVIFPCYPVEASELINLRYLAFTYESYDRTVGIQIPESLSKLKNLQTIVIRRLWNRQFTAVLPSSVWRMQLLRHIILLNGFLPDPDPCDTLPLLNLHSLSRIQNFTCSTRILEMLPNLQKLGIFYSYDGTCEKGWSEYGLHNLVHLSRLEQLSFYAEPGLNLKNEDVSKYIAFPATLKKLTLSCCKFLWEDMTIVGSLILKF